MFSFALRIALLVLITATAGRYASASDHQELIVPDVMDRPIKVAIWLPAEALSGAKDAHDRARGTGHPLIIISHGNGGGLLAHADTAEALAGAGYVVVAIAHTGDTKGDDGYHARKWLVDRTRHLKLVLDYMISEWDGRAAVDGDRIGVFGFSAGGFTALVAAGATPNGQLAQKHCLRTPDEFGCRLGLAKEIALIERRRDAASLWIHDARIKAIVIAAPGLGFSFDQEGLAGVTVPVQLWAASEDRTVPYEANILPLLKGLPNSPQFHLVDKVGHFAFARPCDPAAQPGRNRRSCIETAAFSQTAFHEAFNAQIVDFFDGTFGGPHTP